MESIVKILEQVNLMIEGDNSGAAITILFIILVAVGVYFFVKQSDKHNTFIKDCNEAVRLEFNTKIEKLEASVDECHDDRDRHKIALDMSELRGEELNRINQASERKIEAANQTIQANTKMLTDLVDKFMDRLSNP